LTIWQLSMWFHGKDSRAEKMSWGKRIKRTYVYSFFVPESALEYSVVGFAVVVVVDMLGVVVVSEGVGSLADEFVDSHGEVETAWIELIMGDEVVVGGFDGDLH